MDLRRLLFLSAVSFSVAVACGIDPGGGAEIGSSGLPAEEQPCEPGERMPCACEEGGLGEQVCRESGDGFGACRCEGGGGSGGGAGGFGGSGGSGGAGGSGGGAGGEGGTGGAGGGTRCSTDDDCDLEGGEVCDFLLGACVRPCEADWQCRTELGESCCQAGGAYVACHEALACEGGGGAGGGGGGPASCFGPSDCHASTAYCGEAGTCQSVACGAPGNQCGTCEGAESSPSGPVIWDVRQERMSPDRVCVQDEGLCPEAGWLCAFSFAFYDPQWDVSFEGDGFSYLVLFAPEGGLGETDFPSEIRGDRVFFATCFEWWRETAEGAVQLRDLSWNGSNGLCFSGPTQ